MSLTYFNMLSDGTAINLSMTMPDLASDDWIQTFHVTGSIVKPPGGNSNFRLQFSITSEDGKVGLGITGETSW